jgi:hypothetical protein
VRSEDRLLLATGTCRHRSHHREALGCGVSCASATTVHRTTSLRQCELTLLLMSLHRRSSICARHLVSFDEDVSGSAPGTADGQPSSHGASMSAPSASGDRYLDSVTRHDNSVLEDVALHLMVAAEAGCFATIMSLGRLDYFASNIVASFRFVPTVDYFPTDLERP